MNLFPQLVKVQGFQQDGSSHGTKARAWWKRDEAEALKSEGREAD